MFSYVDHLKNSYPPLAWLTIQLFFKEKLNMHSDSGYREREREREREYFCQHIAFPFAW